MKYDFSVIVLCYNPDMGKLKRTLTSILMQQDISFEIVVADDGSKLNYVSQLQEWFANNDFADYKLVMNEQNRGTVQNLLSALEAASGKYCKNISPGDYLYDDKVLRYYYDCMEQEGLSVCFGRAAYYSYEADKLVIYNRHNPVDLKVYRRKQYSKILRNYFWFRDYALGACLAFELKAAKVYTQQISACVKYAEDTAVIAMLSAGERIGMLDKFAVWYEYGTGISSMANSKWNTIIFEENKGVFRMLAEKDLLAKKTYAYHFEENSSNRYWNLLRKLVLYPPYFFFLLKATWGMRSDKEYRLCEKEKLMKLLEKQ